MIPEVNKALDDVATAEWHLEQAKQALEDALPWAPDIEEVGWLYWEVPRLSAKAIAQRMGANQHELLQLVPPKQTSRVCAECGEPLWAKSRTDFDRIEKEVRWPPTCPGCQEAYSDRRDAEHEARSAARTQRLRDLKAMPYAEYLGTPEWDETRRAALRRAQYRCQTCNADKPLEVHHRTYERLGEEFARDLVALCRDCHTTFHDKRTLARAGA